MIKMGLDFLDNKTFSLTEVEGEIKAGRLGSAKRALDKHIKAEHHFDADFTCLGREIIHFQHRLSILSRYLGDVYKKSKKEKVEEKVFEKLDYFLRGLVSGLSNIDFHLGRIRGEEQRMKGKG